MLDHLDDADQRPRIPAWPHRREPRHRLARRAGHGNRGKLGAGRREGRGETLRTLDLVPNVAALRSATCIAAVVGHLRAGRQPVDPADLARASPPARRPIDLLSRHTFTAHGAIADGELRPLHDPTSG